MAIWPQTDHKKKLAFFKFGDFAVKKKKKLADFKFGSGASGCYMYLSLEHEFANLQKEL